MKTTFFAAALATTTLLSATGWAADAPTTVSHGAKTFMTDAIEANLAEISMSQMALSKSTNPDVKAFAQQMISDHTEANQKAATIAGDVGVTVPTKPGITQRAKGKMVDALSGSAFDKMYVHEMTSDHQSVIAMFQKESAANDGEVSKFATDTLPTLQKHLTDVQALSAKVSAAQTK